MLKSDDDQAIDTLQLPTYLHYFVPDANKARLPDDKCDPFLAPPHPPPWRNPRKERDQNLPSGSLALLASGMKYSR